jgi:exonuclease VII large subunit
MINNQKDKYNNELNITFDRFTDLIPNISEKKLELIANSEKIFNNIKQITEINALKLENINNQLIQMSPNKIFERGFATLQDKTGKQITSISNIKIGDKITTKIIDGKIGSIIENINNKEK